MKRILFFVFIFCFSFLFSETRLYDVKMLGNKIGKSVERWSVVKSKGKCLTKLENNTVLTVSRGGFELKMISKVVLTADCKTLLPETMFVETNESGSKTVTKGKRIGRFFEITVEKNGNIEKRKEKLPKNIVFYSMLLKKYPESFFKKSGKFVVLSEESGSVRETSYTSEKKNNFLHLTTFYAGVPISFWIKGNIPLKTSVQNGLMTYELVKSNFVVPKDNLKKSDLKNDILAVSALKNRGVFVRNPRNVKKMIFLINSKVNLFSTCFQRVVKNSKGVKIVVDNSLVCKKKKDLKKYLKSNIFEDSNNPKIRAIASKWKNFPAKKRVEVAVHFVYKYITNKNYSYGNLSASEILKTKSGDCTEHSTLLSALLKSSGIPVKMVYGLVLSNDGKFYFHNWNEVFFDNSWHVVDATFNETNADASRIVLNYGGSTSVERENTALSVVSFMKNINLFVKDFK